MDKVSIIVPTCRKHCDIGWLFDNLYYVQTSQDFQHQLIIVDDYAEEEERREEFLKLNGDRFPFVHVPPKPNAWRGKHRLAVPHLYALCNARNTGLCYAAHDHIISLDDTSVPLDNWLNLHLQAVKEGVILAGVRHKGIFSVKKGCIVDIEKRDDDYHRGTVKKKLEGLTAHEGYTNNMSFPLDLALQINGFDEKFDGQYGMEDSDFSVRLNRLAISRGIDMYYDPQCALLEGMVVGDKRTKGSRASLYKITKLKSIEKSLCIYTEACKKRRHANEYLLLERTLKSQSRITTLGNYFILADLRKTILNGGAFPAHTSLEYDWRHNKFICDTAGRMVVYHENGKMKLQETYRGPLLHGWSTEWTEDGKIIHKRRYEQGKMVEALYEKGCEVVNSQI